MFLRTTKKIIAYALIISGLVILALLFLNNSVPLVLPNNDFEFLEFRAKASPKIYSFFEDKKIELSPVQRSILYSHKSDLVDIFSIKAWNDGGRTAKGVVSFVTDNISKVGGTTVKKYVDSFKDKVDDIIVFMTNNSKTDNLNMSGILLSRIPVEALQFFESLSYLTLDSCGIENGVEGLSILPHLKVLSLNTNRISEIPNFAIFPQLEKVYLNSNFIEMLDLAESKLNGLESISLINNPGLKVVNFSSNSKLKVTI